MLKNINLKEFIAPIIMIVTALIMITVYSWLQPDQQPRVDDPFEVHKVCGVEDKVKGIDVSYWQSTINWDKLVAETDISFGVARVSDGTHKVDPKFNENWDEMKRVGLIRGAYQFFRPNQDAIKQAQLFVKLLDEAGGMEDEDMPPTLDLEVTGDMSKKDILTGVSLWIEYIIAHTGKYPIIYTGPAFWDSNKLGNEFADFSLWVAHYTGAKCPWAPDAWDSWDFWQYTGSGTLPGINRPVDINVYNGDLLGLRNFIRFSKADYTGFEDASVADVIEADTIDAEVDAEIDVEASAVADVIEEKAETPDVINEFSDIFDAGGPTPPNIGCGCSTPGR